METNTVNTLLSSLVDTITNAVIAKLVASGAVTEIVGEYLSENLNTAIDEVLNDREYNVREEIVEVIENMSFDVTVRSI